MTDREKVIKGLKCCNMPNNHDDCPYNMATHYNICTHQLLTDAIALLKDQEAVKPFIRIHDANISNGTEHVCGYCNGSFLHQHVKFCPWCGKAVKWDD